MTKNNIFLLLSLMYGSLATAYTISIDQQTPRPEEKIVQLTINLADNQSIVKQTMSVSLDTPQVHLGTISYDPAAQKKYVPQFSDSKDVFEKQVIMTIPLETSTTSLPTDAHLHVSFLTLPDSTMNEELYKISFLGASESPAEASSETSHQNTQTYSAVPSTVAKKSFTEKLQLLVQNSDSLWIRLLFALLLGLLLSLTPCIYPMIPITIGVLHNNQKDHSVVKNFLGSICYALGLSTTFAILGLLAAFAGASFGGLLSQPIFVLIIVAFIGYMSLSMIGIIDLTMPSFLQRSTNMSSAFGPFLSAYFFGVVSGSVASPCLSPGLALLLAIVATMGNFFAGFLLLFCFGIGISVPLIIIGTFSSSLSLLPQAGQWMVEIKKALGFIMLATCLYYLNNIMPTFMFHWLVVGYFIFAALFYIIDAQKDFNPKQKTLKSLAGIVLLAIAVVMGMRAYDQVGIIHHDSSEQGVTWADNYDAARITAQAENKLLLIDFWANHCTICKAIDKKLFKKDSVWNALKDKIIFVKVDCTTSANHEANELKKEFQVFAQPAILIVNPETQQVIKKWSSEPYSMTPEAFIAAVKQA